MIDLIALMKAAKLLPRDFAGDVLISDTECYYNLWSIGFKRIRDGKLRVFAQHEGRELPHNQIDSIMRQNVVVGYNFFGYDAPMIAAAVEGRSCEDLKRISDRIIKTGVKPWEIERTLGIAVPRSWSMIDLMEPQPNAFASLKTLNGRMHGRKMQDLPYDPDAILSPEEIKNTLSYMGNDIEATELLLDYLSDAMKLRAELSGRYNMNLMSKSDAQIGESIIRHRVQEITGRKIEYGKRVEYPEVFSYPVPNFIRFETPQLQAIVDRLHSTDFYVQSNGKVDLPAWLDGKKVAIGDTTYAMGIGGLHSTEANRAIISDDEYTLIDFDVSSYYPAIIINSGLFPATLGPAFQPAYGGIRDERVEAKRRAKEIETVELPALRKSKADTEEQKKHIKDRYKTLTAELADCKTKADGGKIAANGSFGKLGNIYSGLYAPHLLIYVTLTGQLSLMMLIERAQKAGFKAVSGNTDGVVFHVRRDRIDALREIVKQWEKDTGFELEDTEYKAIYNQSVNTYLAVKTNGKVKSKGPVANPWREGDKRAQLMKNPQGTVISNAVVDYLTKDIPIEHTIRECTDIRDFVTVIKVNGGATWRGEYLGKVVRYAWCKDGDEILRAKENNHGTHAKVPKTDGCRPFMELPDDLPDDIDYERYIWEARELLMDIGAKERPKPVPKFRLTKKRLLHWVALVA